MRPTLTAERAAGHRTFLFLEGPSSPIFMKIADRLEAQGHRCLRINLNLGDRIFWRRAAGTIIGGVRKLGTPISMPSSGARRSPT